MDTKERKTQCKTPVRRPVQPAGPKLASGAARSGKNRIRKAETNFKSGLLKIF
jgi:hypothetical protein